VRHHEYLSQNITSELSLFPPHAKQIIQRNPGNFFYETKNVM